MRVGTETETLEALAVEVRQEEQSSVAVELRTVGSLPEILENRWRNGTNPFYVAFHHPNS